MSDLLKSVSKVILIFALVLLAGAVYVAGIIMVKGGDWNIETIIFVSVLGVLGLLFLVIYKVINVFRKKFEI